MSSTTPPENLQHPKYRKDIDGLRAIAVLGVVLFHAFPQAFRGGFIGVDIFFVISGFLISTIIIDSVKAGTFSFAVFYRRRVLRIFPALMVVLAFCLLAGWRVLVPSEFRQLGRHVAAGAGFIANFIFLHESGYFDTVAEVKPLLHLWSLGIEEQIYIFWPVILMVGWRRRVGFLRLITVAALLSFALNMVLAFKSPSADFYSPASRFWEFLAGACLICLPFTAARRSLVAALGLALLALGSIFIDRGRVFPGAWATLPTFGAAMLIWSGPEAWVNKNILSNRVLVWIGLISFPLYLWHWPLLSYARIVAGAAPPLEVRLGCVFAALILAVLTYFFVERPIRFGGRTRGWTWALAGTAAAMIVVGLAADKKVFLPASKNLVALNNFDFERMYPPPEGAVREGEKFMLVGANRAEKVLLLGDSHAAQYILTLAGVVEKRAAAGTPVAAFEYTREMIGLDELEGFSRRAAADPAVGTVVISYFWALNYKSEKINNAVRCCGAAVGGSVGGDAFQPAPPASVLDANDRELEAALTILRGAGKRVFLVLDNPFGEELSPKGLVHRDFLAGVDIRVTPLPRELALSRDEPARGRVLGVARKVGVEVVDPYDTLCPSGDCTALFPDGTTTYKDYDHLSLRSVKDFVRYLDPAVDSARRDGGGKAR